VINGLAQTGPDHGAGLLDMTDIVNLHPSGAADRIKNMQLVESKVRPSVRADVGSLPVTQILVKLYGIFDASIGLINLIFVCTGALFAYALFAYILKADLLCTEICLIIIFSTFFFSVMFCLRALMANIVWEIWSSDRDMHDTY